MIFFWRRDEVISFLPAALQADGQEVATVVSAQEIRVVAELLLISPEGLQKAVTFKVTVSDFNLMCMLIHSSSHD